MGASFQTMTLSGDVSRADLKAEFERAQDQDRYENGHSYSGGFGMATGLKFASKDFDSEDAAYEWLDTNAQKWGDAIAVLYRGVEGKSHWMIGANCAC